MSRNHGRFLALFLTMMPLMYAGLPDVKAEPNPDRRAELALLNGGEAIEAAKKFYSEGFIDKFHASLQEVKDSVALAYDSLTSGTKPLAKNAKRGKKAEQLTKQMIRRLDGLRLQVSGEDRVRVEEVQKSVSEIHDQLLSGILERKK